MLQTAYDIITKEHNGTRKLERKEGEGSSFVINLPADCFSFYNYIPNYSMQAITQTKNPQPTL